MDDVKTDFLDKAVEISFYLLLAIPMFFFGGVEQWTKTTVHLVVLAAVSLCLVKAFLDRKMYILPVRYYVVACIFLACLLLSTAFSINMNDSIRSFTLFLDATVVFFVFASQERNRKTFERFIFVILLFGVANSVYAIYSPLIGKGHAGSKLFISGTFYNNNHFASFVELLFFIPPAMLYIKRDMRTWKKAFLFLCMGVFSTALCMSMSRGGIVSVIATLVFFACFALTGRKRKILVATLFFWPQLSGSEQTRLCRLKSCTA